MPTLRHSHRLTPGTAFAASLAALILAGCSSTSETNEAATNSAAGSSSAEQMVGCLKAGGVPAQIEDETGLVMVQANVGYVLENLEDGVTVTSSKTSGEDDEQTQGPLLIAASDPETGLTWAAYPNSDALSEDPELQQVYRDCEAKLPDFEQPKFEFQDSEEFAEFAAKAQKDGLEFARCSRDAGFDWVADPQTAGVIDIPDNVTDSEISGAMDACYKPTYSLSWASNRQLDRHLFPEPPATEDPELQGGK